MAVAEEKVAVEETAAPRDVFEEVMAGMLGLRKEERKADLFLGNIRLRQSDLLADKAGGFNKDQWKELAIHTGLSVEVLQARREVGIEFPPEKRGTVEQPWGVYEQLLRVPADERLHLLALKPEGWTVDEITKIVLDKLEGDRPRKKKSKSKAGLAIHKMTLTVTYNEETGRYTGSTDLPIDKVLLSERGLDGFIFDVYPHK